MRMLVQRTVLAFLAVLSGVCPSTAQNASSSAARTTDALRYPRSERLGRDDRLAVIGDLQRTSFWGRLVLAESNLAEQHWLMSDLANQQFCGVVLLGDMVFSSGDDNWHYFDQLLSPLRQEPLSGVSSTPGSPTRNRWFFPVMGNHDYMGNRTRVTHFLSQRFPGFIGHTHYAFDWHHVRMIVLDGNRSKLCEGSRLGTPACEVEWQAQLAWLRDELGKVDRAPADEQYGAILFVHQAPYTQSPLVAGDQADARAFAQALLDSQRGLALISGHAHGFERYAFRRDTSDLRPAKVFIVSAGGGGPRPHWRRSGAPADLSTLPWPRPFNYLLMRQDAAAVHIDVRGLEKGEQQVVPLTDESVTLPFR